MVTAHDIAALLITEQNAIGHPIDKMQLEKLLYLVQGAHLELWGTPAFREPILAYRNGPVVREIEATYREATEGTEPLSHPFGGHPERLPDQTVETVHLVLQYFGTWTGPNLERFTKRKDSPWRKARGDLPADAHSDMPIEVEHIAAWFRRHGVNPEPPRLSKEERALFERAALGDEEAAAALLR